MTRAEALHAQITEIELRAKQETAPLYAELQTLKATCKHSKLPKRGEFEECCDICPDCGTAFYLYAL